MAVMQRRMHEYPASEYEYFEPGTSDFRLYFQLLESDFLLKY